MTLAVRTSMDPVEYRLGDNELRTRGGCRSTSSEHQRPWVIPSAARFLRSASPCCCWPLSPDLPCCLRRSGFTACLSYAVRRRVREIGIRMALGAQLNDVLRMVVIEGMKPTLDRRAYRAGGRTGAGTSAVQRHLWGKLQGSGYIRDRIGAADGSWICRQHHSRLPRDQGRSDEDTARGVGCHTASSYSSTTPSNKSVSNFASRGSRVTAR